MNVQVARQICEWGRRFRTPIVARPRPPPSRIELSRDGRLPVQTLQWQATASDDPLSQVGPGAAPSGSGARHIAGGGIGPRLQVGPGSSKTSPTTELARHLSVALREAQAHAGGPHRGRHRLPGNVKPKRFRRPGKAVSRSVTQLDSWPPIRTTLSPMLEHVEKRVEYLQSCQRLPELWPKRKRIF
jgi:hypothetical protein